LDSILDGIFDREAPVAIVQRGNQAIGHAKQIAQIAVERMAL
jgi:hypothetical protein